MRRRVAATMLSAVTWIGTATLAVLLVVRRTGADTRFPLTQAVAFLPYLIGAGLVLTAVALARRRWIAAATGGLLAVVLAAPLVARVTDDGGDPAGVRLRVMSVNLRVGAADVAEIAAIARLENVDVIAFQEFTPGAQARLKALTGFAYRSGHPRELALGSALYSRVPMTDAGVRRHPSGFSQAKGVLDVPGAGRVDVESAHPCAPTGAARSACWAGDLADQPGAGDDGVPRILLGDFNATLDHAPMRRLLHSGWTDAASAVGRGLTPTWPYDRPIPKITLDHVLLSRRIAATGFAVHPVRGTDHRCVVADLVIRTP